MKSQVIDTKPIRIMRDVFQPEQLCQLMSCLQTEGHHCIAFEGYQGIGQAQHDSNCKLLLLGATSDQLPQLVKVIRSETAGSLAPILLYLKQALPDPQPLLVPEIDDFLLEPLNLSDLRVRVRRLLQRFEEAGEDLQQVKQNLCSQFGLQQLVGQAPAFLSAIKKIPRLAACDAPVLLTGETGTGKEMCARAIHYLSSRSARPFIPVNCGSIPTELFENELFGHEAGAFTDARQPRRGLIAEAEGGTLFLDEVETLPSPAQAKLLRFLQDRQYKPLGASRYCSADIRLLAASNEDLQAKVRQHAFRPDLYYRLKVVSLWLPSLRDRQDDLVPLAYHFLRVAAYEYRRPVKGFAHSAVHLLSAHKWPGNVRELENTVRQAVILADGPLLQAGDLQLRVETTPAVQPVQEPLKKAKARLIEGFERAYLQDVLAASGGNISQAARAAQKDRRAFFALLKKYDLTHPTKMPFNA